MTDKARNETNTPAEDGTAPASGDEAQIITFGCRLNAYESEVMRKHAQKQGLKNAVIINSCAVTSEAERQFRQSIRRARRENPDAEIIVTGCAVQIDPKRYAEMGEVDRVLGNVEKMREESFAPSGAPKFAVNDIMSARETAGHLIDGFAERTRAFIQVQQGCDHRCTFCIIPFGRGPSRSLDLESIAKQVSRLVEGGVKEVVLTGVDITSYGGDLPGTPSLGQMMKRLLHLVPGLPRLRLSSVDPVEIDDDTFWLLENEPRFMPHLHLSVQAGDDMILKRMKRRHLRDDVLRVVERARAVRPDTVFGADFIAGFPTETEEMFGQTLDLVERAGLTWLHVFPYSERRGTPAARMPQVAKPIRKERAARLRALGKRMETAFLHDRIGGTAELLLEKNGEGRSEHYAPVVMDGTEGAIVRARITGIDDKGRLIGEPA